MTDAIERWPQAKTQGRWVRVVTYMDGASPVRGELLFRTPKDARRAADALEALAREPEPSPGAEEVARNIATRFYAQPEEDTQVWDEVARCDSVRTLTQYLAPVIAEQRADAERQAVQVHYLPMDCPVCDRRRLEYDPAAHTIVCEKCGTEHHDAD